MQNFEWKAKALHVRTRETNAQVNGLQRTVYSNLLTSSLTKQKQSSINFSYFWFVGLVFFFPSLFGLMAIEGIKKKKKFYLKAQRFRGICL